MEKLEKNNTGREIFKHIYLFTYKYKFIHLYDKSMEEKFSRELFAL